MSPSAEEYQGEGKTRKWFVVSGSKQKSEVWMEAVAGIIYG